MVTERLPRRVAYRRCILLLQRQPKRKRMNRNYLETRPWVKFSPRDKFPRDKTKYPLQIVPRDNFPRGQV